MRKDRKERYEMIRIYLEELTDLRDSSLDRKREALDWAITFITEIRAEWSRRGKKGGASAARRMTPEQRSEKGRNAAHVMHAARKKG